uniref:AIG1-type G domain-containing protein n=1 Tax=Anas platyrhynchos TaxID=8839 RepID=A0A8B9T6I2_ANAPL
MTEPWEMRLILAGKAGEGKSATGNTLLGECVFESKLSSQPVTVSCASAQGHWDGEDFTVVDTADIFNPGGASSEVRQEIIRCIRLSSPGPHALLLVTQLGPFTQEKAKAAERLQDIFGADVFRHTIIIFTRAEELGERSLHDYVSCTHNKALRELIERCGNSAQTPAQQKKTFLMSQRASLCLQQCPYSCVQTLGTPPGVHTHRRDPKPQV